MNNNSSPKTDQTLLRALIIKRIFQMILTMLILIVCLFIPAGRLFWVWGWAYMGVYLTGLLYTVPVMFIKCPELVAERAQTKADAKDWDRKLSKYASLFYLTTLVIAGLDFRFGWSAGFPLWVHLSALILGLLGYSLFNWSMLSNKYFSGTVRIQQDRDHAVVMTGPYKYIRHPGYTGLGLFTVVTPLILGSFWSLIPMMLFAGAMVYRTALEDKTLIEELEGYQAYAQQVRFRLMPGVW